jgi:acetoin utilization protein AcuB
MRVEEIMTTSVQSVTPDVDVATARAQMRRAGIRHLVVMRSGQVLGIVSERDLIRVRPRLVDDIWTVEDVMTTRVVIAAPETSVRQAANLMRGHVIGCLPIVDGKRLVGIVTTSDLLDMIGRESAANRLQPRAADEEALSEEDEAPLIRS